MLCRTGKQGSDRADAPLQLTDKAERKGERDGESGRLPERFSGQRRFRPHLSDGGSACGRVLVLAERSDATCTKTSTRPIVKFVEYSQRGRNYALFKLCEVEFFV